ncbi:oxygen-sensitive ribonucleoside-triphosphate reductase [Cenarchaeum symbiosum A]|uniref:Oxygen-sensitive ribonucleoside-triphosphate reductase n=1 Tax=Cenarchaeum symbiosum (strain A) TaxID=414004 RepID=A0RYG4_CENSY|nr:oxygen-sensitive ribonucleoside-triphosphate reductase [Cenarchaeum symbiosum A]
MQRGSVTLTVNLVGLREAVFNVLGYENDKAGREILHKVVETAVDVAKKKGKELGDDVRISMTEGGGASRFAVLDGEKYGKNSALKTVETYSEGVVLDSGEQYTAKSDGIAECNRLSKMLNGGLLVMLPLDRDADDGKIREVLERTAGLIARFRPVKPVSICGGCGYKDGRLEGRCPRCKSSNIL